MKRTILKICNLLLALVLFACGGGGGGGGGGSPVSVPRFAFVTNGGDDTISIYSIDAVSGRLRHNGYVPAGTGTRPTGIAVHPSGLFAYVANFDAQTVVMYAIDPKSGALTAPFHALTAPSSPLAVAIDPSGKFVYALNEDTVAVTYSVSGYTVAANTGALTAITGVFPSGTGVPKSVSVDPSGRFVYIAATDALNVYTLESDGHLTFLEGFPAAGLSGDQPSSFGVDPLGRFAYMATINSVSSAAKLRGFAIKATGPDPIDTDSTSIGVQTSIGIGVHPVSVVVDPSGRFVYVLGNPDGVILAFAIDAGSGALTPLDADGNGGNGITGFPVGQQPVSITADPSGKFLYAPDPTKSSTFVLAIDANSGFLTAAGNISSRDIPTALAIAAGTIPVAYAPKFAYAANSGSNVSTYSVDSLTGVLSPRPTDQPGDNLTSISVNPSGTLVYGAANAGIGLVITYAVGADGTLTEVGHPANAEANTSFVAVDPSGRFVYATNRGSNDVAAYAADPITGLNPIDANPSTTTVIDNFPVGRQPAAVAVDPSGRFAYVANSLDQSISVFSIDPVSGTLTSIDADDVAAGTQTSIPVGGFPSFIAIDPTGKFLYAPFSTVSTSGGVSGYTINTITGALTRIDTDPNTAGVQDFSAGIGPVTVAIVPSGRFAYVVNSSTVTVHTIDAGTGALAQVASVPVSLGGNLVFGVLDPSGGFLYVASSSNNVAAFAVNTDTGGLTAVAGSPFPAGTTPVSIAVTGTIQ